MFKKLNDLTLKAFVAVSTGLPASLVHAQQQGFKDAEGQVKDQGQAAVSTLLLLAFIAGVIMVVFGVAQMRKIGKQQLQDEEKVKMGSLTVVGILLMIIPTVIAFAMGVIGDDTTSDAVGTMNDWDL